MHHINRTLRRTCLLVSVFGLTLTLYHSAVSADDTNPGSSTTAQLSRIVVTANSYPTEIDEVGSAISVIDEGEIRKRRRDTVAELLRTVPGLEVVQTGGIGRATSVFIRGAESDHTLVLIDGIRVNDNTTGAYNFGNLKAENIERIEVLRGPQSVLYGSEAIGGVINIITKKAEEGIKSSFSAEGGSFDSQQYLGSFRWGSKDAYTSNTVSFLDREGFSVARANRGNPEDDAYNNFTVSSANGVTFLEDGTADLTLRYSRTNAELDDFEFGVGPVDNLFFDQETDTFASALTVSKPISESIIPTLTLGLVDEDAKGEDPTVEFNNFSIDSQSTSVLTQVDIIPSWDGVFSLGYRHEEREAENRGSFEEKRNLDSVFVQKQYSLTDSLFLTGGVRYDDDSGFGGEVTYRTTAAYKLADSGTRFHATYGTGFKAPIFNELFFPNFGNPDLNPETSWGYDAGVEQRFFDNRGLIDVTFLQSEIEDLIAFNTTTFLAENIKRSEIWGIEATESFELTSWLTQKASYTYTESEDTDTGLLLARRPLHRGTLQFLLSPLEALEASATLVVVNDRIDSDGGRMDNYELVNLTFHYSVTENVKLFVRIDNLLDEGYEEVPGYGTAGLSAYAGVEVSL